MKKLNIDKNKNFENFLIIIFSLVPVSIISGNAVMEVNFLIITISFLIYLTFKKSLIDDIKKDYSVRLLIILWIYLIFNSFLGEDLFNSFTASSTFNVPLILLLRLYDFERTKVVPSVKASGC